MAHTFAVAPLAGTLLLACLPTALVASALEIVQPARPLPTLSLGLRTNYLGQSQADGPLGPITYAEDYATLDARLRLWQGEAGNALWLSSSIGMRRIRSNLQRIGTEFPTDIGEQIDYGFTDVQAGTLRSSDIQLPDAVYDISLRFGGSWTIGNYWRFLAQISVASPSDKPFASFDETDFGAEFYGRYGGERHGLIFGVTWRLYDDQLGGAPLPVLAWHYTPTDRFSLVAGLPILSAVWRPDGWFMRALVVATTYDVAVNWYPWQSGTGWTRGLGFGVRARSNGWRALPAEREDADDDLRYGDHRVSLAGSLFMGPGRSLNLEAGWSYGREFRYGEDEDNEREQNLGQGVFAELRANWIF